MLIIFMLNYFYFSIFNHLPKGTYLYTFGYILYITTSTQQCGLYVSSHWNWSCFPFHVFLYWNTRARERMKVSAASLIKWLCFLCNLKILYNYYICISIVVSCVKMYTWVQHVMSVVEQWITALGMLTANLTFKLFAI